jgi:hypothetical protein
MRAFQAALAANEGAANAISDNMIGRTYDASDPWFGRAGF